MITILRTEERPTRGCATCSGPDEHVQHVDQVRRVIKEEPVDDKIMLQLLKASPVSRRGEAASVSTDEQLSSFFHDTRSQLEMFME